jgi:hypothetical protein
MVRAFGALFVLCWAVVSFSQSFGRFGYTQSPEIGGFRVDKDSITIVAPGMEPMRFPGASKTWRPQETSAERQLVQMGGGLRRPVKARLDLAAPGPEFYFESGMELDLNGIGAPYISWSDGTSGANVPTPECNWVLLTFRDQTPPILVLLQSGTGTFTVKGKPGAWRLATDGVYKGWIRFVLPFGTDPLPAANAATLGKVLRDVAPLLKTYQAPTPKLLKRVVESDRVSVAVEWIYDGPGAVVPSAVLGAKKGGYGIGVSPKLTELPGWFSEGPRAVLPGNVLRVRFPMRRVPSGRGLGIGDARFESAANTSAFDIPGVVELALQNLSMSRDISVSVSAEDVLAKYLQDADYATEPYTGGALPFTKQGHGMDLAAAHALLMQSISVSVRSDSEANGLLTSLLWRRDAQTWMLMADDHNIARRATTLASMAGLLCPEDDRRAEAGMLQAGLAADQWLLEQRKKRGEAIGPTIDSLGAARNTLFGIQKTALDPSALLLTSPIRVYGPEAFFTERQGDQITLRWEAGTTKAGQFSLACSFPTKIVNVNLKSLETRTLGGMTTLRYEPSKAGICEIKITVPKWVGDLPTAVQPPGFVEVQLQ